MLFRFPLFFFNPRLFFVRFLCFHSICHSHYLWSRIFETHSQIMFENISSYQKIDLRLNSFDLGKIYIFHLTLSIFLEIMILSYELNWIKWFIHYWIYQYFLFSSCAYSISYHFILFISGKTKHLNNYL